MHKDNNGFTEEQKSYRPSEIEVFRYECPYDEEQIIARARKIVEKNEPFNVKTSNCEHFVRQCWDWSCNKDGRGSMLLKKPETCSYKIKMYIVDYLPVSC